ncbi:methyltransferase domain-containing protein [Deinococcus sp. UYEF24]
MNSPDRIDQANLSATERFSTRAEHYARARPGYPAEILVELQRRGVWSSGTVVADVGSGTGLLARLFLDGGSAVTGVEPNGAMRAAGDRELRSFLQSGQFRSVDGTAEATTLVTESVDLVVCGQAAHWFDAAEARKEFRRVLKQQGWLALIWNDWRHSSQPLALAYLKLIERYATHQTSSEARVSEELVSPFFAPGPFTGFQVSNPQQYTRESWTSRALSVSYLPEEGTPGVSELLRLLGELFDIYQEDGLVELEYRSHVFLGRLSGGP